MTTPARQGLYDPADEHDACGIGFVAHLRGERSRDIVRDALQLLRNLAHRGAAGRDPTTGDGAGILLQLPHAFLWRACSTLGLRLPESGGYGVGMVFLPTDPERRRVCERLIEHAAGAHAFRVIGWRDVPVDARHAGPDALRNHRPLRHANPTAH